MAKTINENPEVEFIYTDEDKLDFICYDPINHKYKRIGKEIADAFISGLNLK